MKDIFAILTDFKIEVAEDQKEAIRKAVAENYVTDAEHTKKIGKLETERDGLKEQLAAANETLKGFEGVDIGDLKKQLDDYKEKAEKVESEYKAKLAERDYNDAVNTALSEYRFSSRAARNAVVAQIKESGVELKDGKLDITKVIEKIKAEDAGAFEQEGGARPHFTAGREQGGTGRQYTSKSEILGIKDAAARQKAIAENMDLFTTSQQEE